MTILRIDATEWIDYRFVEKSSYLYTNQYVDEPKSSSEAPPESSSSTTASPIRCTKPGLTCKDCQTLILCLYENGELIEEVIENCNNGFYCNVNSCSETPPRECQTTDFKCKSIDGVFPDPADCAQYHYCVSENDKLKEKPFTHKCTDDYQYNSLTTYCDKKMVNNTCNGYPVPICNTVGQVGGLKENPSIYYICKPYGAGSDILYPFLYICEHGKKYTENYGCK